MATDNSGNPILEQYSEDDFVDCIFKISDLVESAEFFNFHLSAASKSIVLGIDVALRKDIKAYFDSQMNPIKEHHYRNGVSFIRSGDESDRLIERIAELYGFPSAGVEMVTKETFTAIALHQEEINLKTDAVKIKLFGKDVEPFDQEAYYESFFNVDLVNGFVSWNEKDPEYRKPLIQALARQPAIK
jgi:hypothetical protein